MISSLSTIRNTDDNIQIFNEDIILSLNVSNNEIENDEEYKTLGNKITNDWQNMIVNWIELIEDEVQDLEIKKTNVNENFDIIVTNISQIVYLINNIQAKWNLCNIFVNNLEFSNYLESFVIRNN
ncbi:16239_t:CDS:1 [Funneliformis mosseae]|uniref:16239_t:CDS:1 n=1 Tax=Funneliformis mosseae TaxID=27381 RepID=A0A9N9GDH0_FUNMO|nr:16239_t:CDS:1 [Funneliformis mosseae]